MSRDDELPRSFKQKDQAPVVQLTKFAPPYATRTRVRASVLLQPKTPAYAGPRWALVYYLDFPRMKIAAALSAIEKLRSTPGDLVARYFFMQGAGGGLALAERYFSDSTWMAANQAALHKFVGIPVGMENNTKTKTKTKKKKKKKKHVNRSGDEKIEHIAFHPTKLLLAMSTTYARVHLFDLRTNKFIDYFLCAADDPADLVITALAFNSLNQLAVGMDNGFVDIWTLDLSGAGILFEIGMGGSFGHRRAGRPQFFDSQPSPGTRAILMKGRPVRQRDRATVERVELVKDGFRLVGAVTAVAFSPSGTHVAVGTSTGGVWIYNLTMATSYRAHMGSLSAASAKCTALSWAVSPSAKYIPLRRESGAPRYQLETGETALVAGMEDGAVVYLAVRNNGTSSITLGLPVEFHPSRLAPGAPHDTAVSHVLVVPSPPGTPELYPPFPTLVVALADSPGIHIFRLLPESVLKASVPSAASASIFVVPASDFRTRSKQLYRGAERLLRDWYAGHNAVRMVHVGTLDTSSVVFPRTTAAAAVATQDGYGGIVKSMAIDPTAQRLVVSFSGSGSRVEDSVVWFDAGAIGAATSVLGALQVVRPQRVIPGDAAPGEVGEVSFAGGFEGGACAGMITGGGRGVVVFPAWIPRREWEE